MWREGACKPGARGCMGAVDMPPRERCQVRLSLTAEIAHLVAVPRSYLSFTKVSGDVGGWKALTQATEM